MAYTIKKPRFPRRLESPKVTGFFEGLRLQPFQPDFRDYPMTCGQGSPSIHMTPSRVTMYPINAAFVSVWLVTRHPALFDGIYSADLAGHSQALTHYEASSIDTLWLAASRCPDSLAGRGLGIFRTGPEQTLRFVARKASKAVAAAKSTEMCHSCCFNSFWEPKYNTPPLVRAANATKASLRTKSLRITRMPQPSRLPNALGREASNLSTTR